MCCQRQGCLKVIFNNIKNALMKTNKILLLSVQLLFRELSQNYLNVIFDKNILNTNKR